MVLAGLLAVGCGNKDPEVSLAVSAARKDALVVAGQVITADEIIQPLTKPLAPAAQASDLEKFKQEARPAVEQALKDRISYVLLHEQVKKEVGDKIDEALDRGAEREIRNFLVGFGGDYARAQEYLTQQGMDWDGFRKHQKKMILVSSQMPQSRPITYSELLDRYNQTKDELFATEGTITLRLIDIEVAKLEAGPNPTQLEKARGLANELVKRIQAGEDFGALAGRYSHGYRREFGGLWKPRRPESLAPPYDVLAAEAEKMEPGQVAGPIETKNPTHVFIMKLEDKQPKTYEPFEQVQREMEGRIAFERRLQAAAEIDAKLAQRVRLEQSAEFIDFCLEKIYRTSKQ